MWSRNKGPIALDALIQNIIEMKQNELNLECEYDLKFLLLMLSANC